MKVFFWETQGLLFDMKQIFLDILGFSKAQDKDESDWVSQEVCLLSMKAGWWPFPFGLAVQEGSHTLWHLDILSAAQDDFWVCSRLLFQKNVS